MKFSFHYEITVGGVMVAECDGHALIVPNSHGSWLLDGLELDGLVVNDRGGLDQVEVTLAITDPLYAPIAIWLLKTHDDEIDAAWRAHCRTNGPLARYDANRARELALS